MAESNFLLPLVLLLEVGTSSSELARASFSLSERVNMNSSSVSPLVGGAILSCLSESKGFGLLINTPRRSATFSGKKFQVGLARYTVIQLEG